MPLSDDEQRILLEIEKDFYDTDPEFAREVSETTLTRHALRNIRWAVLGGVLGLVGIGLGLQIHFALSFVAFLVVFASAVVIERNVRKMGKLGSRESLGFHREALSTEQRRLIRRPHATPLPQRPQLDHLRPTLPR